MEIAITGLSVLSRFGEGPRAFWEGLSSPAESASPLAVPVESSGPTRAGELLARAVRALFADFPPQGAAERRASLLSISKLGIDSLLGSGGGIEAYCDPTREAREAAGARGPALSPIAACATGLAGLLRGARLIEAGDAEEAVVGVGEASLLPLLEAGFERMGVISRTRPRPFDSHRDGFVLAEGAAAFLLELPARARARGARILATVLGGATRAATGLFRFDSGGREIVSVARAALRDAGISQARIGLVHAHATGTRLGDAAEAAALAELELARTPTVSTKGATGHALGASGGFSAVASILSLARGIAPPTAGLVESEFRLCVSPAPQALSAPHALALAYGFGGQLAAVVLGR